VARKRSKEKSSGLKTNIQYMIDFLGTISDRKSFTFDICVLGGFPSFFFLIAYVRFWQQFFCGAPEICVIWFKFFLLIGDQNIFNRK
jgi:hypothetical protein